MNTNKMMNEEMALTINNFAAGEEELSAENLMMVSGGCYNVPCNVCGKYFRGLTPKLAESKLALHTLSSSHNKNLRAHGYAYYHNLPYWG